MSFGFGVGDFINVGTLAFLLYQRCRASVTEFKDLSRDVRSMHICLTAVREYWEEQAQDGQELSARHLATLQELSHNCKEVLEDLEALLDKHGDLGAGAGFLARMKWAPKHIGPLRMRLLVRTQSLSNFNNVITASSAANEQRKCQARVLEALNLINLGYHSGKRSAPAFSQAVTEKADMNNKETWREIVQDLNDEGIDKESLDSQETFIKSWIDEVILADEGYCSDEGSQIESERETYSIPPSSFMGGEPYCTTLASQPPASPSKSPRELFRAQTVPTVATQPPFDVPYRPPRQSQGSVSSQDHRARLEQPHTTNTSHIKETLMPLFRLEYGVSRDELFLQSTIEHLYNRLDVLKRGLYRAQFESPCLQAIESIEPTARASVVDIIHAAARTTAGHFDQSVFTELFFAILERLQAIKDKELEARVHEDQAVVEESDRWGESIAYSWLCSETDPQLIRKILPRNYATNIQSGVYTFTSAAEDVVCHDIGSPDLPGAAMSTFAGMSLLADFCNAQILHIAEVWSQDNPMDRNYLNQYLNILYNVLGAGHKYDVLACGLHEEHPNLLDRLIGEADLIDLTEPSNLEYESCPIQELRKLQHDSYRTLQKILGFLFDLTSDSVQKDVKDNKLAEFVPGRQNDLVLKYLETPPRPAHWRMKMEMQAENILAECTGWHAASEATVVQCQNWYLEHSSLSRRADDALTCSKKLKQQAKKCHHLIPRNIAEPITDKFVGLRIESLRDLPRGNKLFRAQVPKIFAKVIVDGDRLHNQSAALDKRAADKAYVWGGDPYHITVHAKSIIQIRIHNANRLDRFDEGYQGVVHIPVDSLVTAVQARPQTVELSNNFYKGTECKGMLTFTIHWCTTTQFLRQQAGLFSGHWARKDTADGRFLFEDLEARDTGPCSRTAIVERRKDSLKLTPTKLQVQRPS